MNIATGWFSGGRTVSLQNDRKSHFADLKRSHLTECWLVWPICGFISELSFNDLMSGGEDLFILFYTED